MPAIISRRLDETRLRIERLDDAVEMHMLLITAIKDITYMKKQNVPQVQAVEYTPDSAFSSAMSLSPPPPPCSRKLKGGQCLNKNIRLSQKKGEGGRRQKISQKDRITVVMVVHNLRRNKMMRKTCVVGLGLQNDFSLLSNGQKANVILTNQAVPSSLSAMPGSANFVISVATTHTHLLNAKHILKIIRYLHCVKLV